MKRLSLCALVLIGTSGSALAEGERTCATRAIEVDAFQERAGMALEAELRRGNAPSKDQMKPIRKAAGKASSGEGTIKAGEFMEICFKSSQDGYVTVWDTDAEGYVSLLYPNVFSAAGKNGLGEKVKGGEQSCIGTEKFRLRIRPPVGASQVYVHWTPTLDSQLKPSDFPFVREQKANKRTLALLSSGAIQAAAEKRGCKRGVEIEEQGKEAKPVKPTESSTSSTASGYASLTLSYETQP